MPINVYECKKCKASVEKLEKIGEVSLKCDKCGTALKKIICGGNFVLKGDGFYKPSRWNGSIQDGC
jgi:putative FmdB family regulatory protein